MRFRQYYEVSSHDTDVNNNIKPSMLVRYMQETAMRQLRDRKPTYQRLFGRGLSFVVTGMTIEISHLLHEFDRIETATWSCPGKGATFIRCFEIKRDGESAARAYSSWALNNIRTGKICKTSEVDISNYESEEAFVMNLPTRVSLPRGILYEKAGEREVMYSDVDINFHMNNTNYPNMLWDYVPGVENKIVTSMNFRFMREAALGSRLVIYRGRLGSPVKGDPLAAEGYCFASMTEDNKVNVKAVFGMAALPPNR